MTGLPGSIPRARNLEKFYQEPLGFLAENRARCGDIFVIQESGPIFSRAEDCNGAIAVFGPERHQAVLSDIDLYAMPISAAYQLALPPELVNLNRGLHSMLGDEHAKHQRLLLRVLSERGLVDEHEAIRMTTEELMQSWQTSKSIRLLHEMRRFALHVSTRLLFGDSYSERADLATSLREYFQLRREVASPANGADFAGADDRREGLIELGTSLDKMLRRYIKWCRSSPSDSADGLLGRLARLEFENGGQASEDSLVAHCNVLFMSSNEPIAVSLTWILLLLSQLPELRQKLRNELDETPSQNAEYVSSVGRSSLFDAVINESLRLLTPNALMVRITTRPAMLCGVELPEQCEILLCPFLAHRDPARFPQPTKFLLSRWDAPRPSPFEYFPFGAGGHSCVGRHLAFNIIKSTLKCLMSRCDLVLAEDQEIDWSIHVMLTPSSDPLMKMNLGSDSSSKGGKLLGPVSELIDLDHRRI